MKMCPQCHRAGPKLGQCGAFALCPGRVSVGEDGKRSIDPDSVSFPEIDPDRDAVLHCPACNQTAAFPVHDILTGKTRVDFRCQRSAAHCECRVVFPTSIAPEPPVAPTPRTRTSKAK